MSYVYKTEDRTILLDEFALLENGHLPNEQDLNARDIYRLVDEIPPHNSDTHYPEKLLSSYWEKIDNVYHVRYKLVARDINGLKRSKKEEVTAKRWEVLTGGITLPNGVKVGTNNDDQNRISSVVSNAHLAGLTDSSKIDFKSNSGWVSITLSELKQIVGLIGNHIQQCFSLERAQHEAIDTLSDADDIVNFDYKTAWKSIGNA